MNKNIINSWTLVEFAAQEADDFAVMDFTDEESGESYRRLVCFGKEQKYIKFSNNLGELTEYEIIKQAANLQIVERYKYNKDGSVDTNGTVLVLCKKGEMPEAHHFHIHKD